MILNESFEGKITQTVFEKGAYVYRQNQLARWMFEIKSGEIAITNINDQGKQFIQNIYRSGDCFGISSLICEKTYSASAIAQKDSEIFLIPKKLFFHLIKNDFEFHFKITQTLAKQFLYKTMMLEEVANEEGEHRLLTLIHYLMQQKSVGNKSLDTTKQQLADMTGLRVETVIRILKRLEDKGKIASQRGKIVCLNDNK